MTLQNLSIVFGPTILIPSEQLDDIGGALRQIKVSQKVMTVLQMHGLELENDEVPGCIVGSVETQEEILERLKGVMSDNEVMNTRMSTKLNRGNKHTR